MAVDELLLREVDLDSPPILRLYGWSAPTLSLGYAQNVDRHVNRDVCVQRNVPVVRRLTGGKAVLHDKELTYAIIGHPNRFPYHNDLMDSYKIIGEAFVRSFEIMGIRAEMAENRQNRVRKGAMSSCFAAPSAYEILVAGRKILGSAQKRTAGGILQHGSLLFQYCSNDWESLLSKMTAVDSSHVTSLKRELSEVPDFHFVSRAIQQGFQDRHNIQFQPFELSSRQLEIIDGVARDNYPDLSC